MALYEDLVTPYVGPGFCCKVSCKFFAYESFHKPIEGCKGYDDFMARKPSTAIFDQSFTLEYFIDLLRTNIGSATIRNAQYPGVNHSTVKVTKSAFRTQSFVRTSISLLIQLKNNHWNMFRFYYFGTSTGLQADKETNLDSVEVISECAGNNDAYQYSFGNFLNNEGRFYCPFPSCACSVSHSDSKGWANVSSILNHLKSHHKR